MNSPLKGDMSNLNVYTLSIVASSKVAVLQKKEEKKEEKNLYLNKIFRYVKKNNLLYGNL